MQAIDQASLVTVMGGQNAVEIAARCATATAEDYAPLGTVAGAVAGGIASGPLGAVAGAGTGRTVATGLGLFAGFFGSLISQAFGGDSCPTAPSR